MNRKNADKSEYQSSKNVKLLETSVSPLIPIALFTRLITQYSSCFFECVKNGNYSIKQVFFELKRNITSLTMIFPSEL